LLVSERVFLIDMLKVVDFAGFCEQQQCCK
jgi:hypothetical protein